MLISLCDVQGRKWGGVRQPPVFENFVFFALKNCAFESILVTNLYERNMLRPLLPDLQILPVDAPLP